jgi:4-hydroxy-4-methyl-2-oxoglutarate aldolase
MSELTEAERGEWAALPTTAISDAMGRRHVFAARLRPRTGAGLIGRAYCVRVVAGDSGSLHLALEDVPAGSVLVVDAGGFRDRAVWGEVLTAAAQGHGVIGAVIDGAIRDVEGIRRRNFPIYSAAITPAGPHKAGGGSWGGTVSCGGVPVATGDLIVADEDGVVAVPWEGRKRVRLEAGAILVREDHLMKQVDDNGISTARYLGLIGDE